MSVSQVNRDRQNSSEEVSRGRQDAKEAEAEQIKKQKRQIDALNRQHEEAMQKLTESYNQTLENQSARTREVLSEKDQKYKREMDELKNIYAQRLREESEKNANDVGQLRSAKDQELKVTQQRGQTKTVDLEKNYMRQMNERDHQTAVMATDMRDEQNIALKEQRGRLAEAHQDETTRLRDDRDQEVGGLKTELSMTREEKHVQEKKAREEKERLLRKQERFFMSQLEDERRQSNDMVSQHREAYKESLKDEGRKYSLELNKQDESHKKFRDDWAETVNRRQQDSVDVLERNLMREKTTGREREQNVRRLSQLENKHQMEDAQKRIDDIDRRLSQTQEYSKQETSREIDDMGRKNHEAMKWSEKRHQDEIDKLKNQEIAGYRNQLNSYKASNENRSVQGIERDRKINDVHLKELRAKTDFYEDRITDQAKMTSEQLRDQRNVSEQERNSVVEHLQKQLRETENVHSQKMGTLTARYEDQLQNVKLLHDKESRRQQEIHDMRTKEQDRRFQTDLDRERSQSLVQREQLKDKYEKEIDFLKRRHEQEKIELSKKKV